MPQRHGPRPLFGGDPRKEAVAEPAGRVLEGEAVSAAEGARVRRFGGEVDTEPTAGVRDEGGVGLGLLPPQAVVEMCGVEPQRRFAARAGQGVEKSEGVRAARHSDHHQVVLRQPAASRGVRDLRFESLDQPLLGHGAARRAPSRVRPAGRWTAF